jgi:4-amino-4-deoxychorismate lyase
VKATCLFNGAVESGQWSASRALHYGDGVFRTALVIEGRVVDRTQQLAKLAADAEALGLDPRAAAKCGREAAALAREVARGVVKMIVWRKAQQRGYRPTMRTAERLVMLGELPRLRQSAWSRGVQAMRSPIVLGAQPRLAGLKHLNRLEQVLASDGWPAGIDEAILGDEGGRPIGGTRSNLFWIARGRLYTPELSRCGVAGVMRQKVLELAQQMGASWRIERGTWREFERADEAFLTNSLIGIWPLRGCGERRWRAPGPVTRTLMAHLAHPWSGS